jgi:hypothetical protein
MDRLFTDMYEADIKGGRPSVRHDANRTQDSLA